MENSVTLLGIMTAVFAAVAVQAWRLGNEKRDIAALGVFAGLFGIGTAAVALV
jgi:hypothetical protein